MAYRNYDVSSFSVTLNELAELKEGKPFNNYGRAIKFRSKTRARNRFRSLRNNLDLFVNIAKDNIDGWGQLEDACQSFQKSYQLSPCPNSVSGFFEHINKISNNKILNRRETIVESSDLLLTLNAFLIICKLKLHQACFNKLIEEQNYNDFKSRKYTNQCLVKYINYAEDSLRQCDTVVEREALHDYVTRHVSDLRGAYSLFSQDVIFLTNQSEKRLILASLLEVNKCISAYEKRFLASISDEMLIALQRIHRGIAVRYGGSCPNPYGNLGDYDSSLIYLNYDLEKISSDRDHLKDIVDNTPYKLCEVSRLIFKKALLEMEIVIKTFLNVSPSRNLAVEDMTLQDDEGN